MDAETLLLLLTSRLRSLMLWHVLTMDTSISSVASLAWTDCCYGPTERKRERGRGGGAGQIWGLDCVIYSDNSTSNFFGVTS